MRFIGTGTGRCGTMSLARILSTTPRSDVTHERFWPLWYGGPAQPAVIEAASWLAKYEDQDDHLVGDVSSFWLPHIPSLQKAVPGLKAVCLHRPRADVVESFLKWCGGLSNLRPCDMFIRVEHPVHKQYINLFPTIDHLTAKEAWEVYWDICEKLMTELPDPVYHMDMEELNSNIELDALHSFLEIDPEDRIRPEKRRYNKQDQQGISR